MKHKTRTDFAHSIDMLDADGELLEALWPARKISSRGPRSVIA
jgi:hypothetical protein